MNKQKLLGKKGASFIKIVGGNFRDQMKIPHGFNKTFNGFLPHRFIIENSMTKKCWRVEVEKDGDGTIYFRDGWSAFVEAHCLEFGNFLLFEYEEQSIFQVKIYGRNGCPKNTFVKTNECRPNSPKVTDIEEENKCEHKVFREDHQQTDTEKNDNRILKKNQAAMTICKRLSRVDGNKKSFSFMLTMKYQFRQQNIPAAVILENKLASRKEVVLQVDDANCWTVQLGHKKGGQSVFLGRWKNFLEENNIAFGHRLDIKFVSDKLAQVHVTRSSQPANHLHEPKFKSKDGESPPMDCENGKKAECEQTCSSFSFPWTKSKASDYLYIPRAIAMEQMLKDKEGVTLRDSGGNDWLVEVKKWRDGRMDLTKGWNIFWKSLAIKDGDTLECQFVSHRVIQVKIKRHERPNESTIGETTIDSEVTDTNGAPSDLFA